MLQSQLILAQSDLQVRQIVGDELRAQSRRDQEQRRQESIEAETLRNANSRAANSAPMTSEQQAKSLALLQRQGDAAAANISAPTRFTGGSEAYNNAINAKRQRDYEESVRRTKLPFEAERAAIGGAATYSPSSGGAAAHQTNSSNGVQPDPSLMAYSEAEGKRKAEIRRKEGAYREAKAKENECQIKPVMTNTDMARCRAQ